VKPRQAIASNAASLTEGCLRRLCYININVIIVAPDIDINDNGLLGAAVTMATALPSATSLPLVPSTAADNASHGFTIEFLANGKVINS
jgi:hypothetical protein